MRSAAPLRQLRSIFIVEWTWCEKTRPTEHLPRKPHYSRFRNGQRQDSEAGEGSRPAAKRLKLVADRHFHFSCAAARSCCLGNLSKGARRGRIERQSVRSRNVPRCPWCTRAEVHVVEHVERRQPQLQSLLLRRPRHRERFEDACVRAEISRTANCIARPSKTGQ